MSRSPGPLNFCWEPSSNKGRAPIAAVVQCGRHPPLVSGIPGSINPRFEPGPAPKRDVGTCRPELPNSPNITLTFPKENLTLPFCHAAAAV